MAATFTEQTALSASPKENPYDIWDRGGRKSVTGLLLRVYPSGKKTWFFQIGRGNREKVGKYPTITLSAARSEAKTIGGDAEKGRDFQAERRQKRKLKDNTLEVYLDGPFKEHAEANIASHRDMLRAIRKGFSMVLDKPMNEISELDMAKWRRNRADVSIETRRRELTYLKALLNHAVSSRVIPGHQLGQYRVKGTLKDGGSESKVRFLSPEEEGRLRTALDEREAELKESRIRGNAWRAERHQPLYPEVSPDEYADHIKPIVLLALNTGLRRGDLFTLKWDHVDLGRRQIRKIISKTSHARRKAGKKLEPAVLPMSAEAHSILTQCKKQRNPESDYVLPSPRSGGPLTDIKKGFEAVLAAANIKHFRFHDLRHSFASKLVMAGVDINTVRELMTHADIKMTLVYAHLSPDHKAAALERAFGGGQ